MVSLRSHPKSNPLTGEGCGERAVDNRDGSVAISGSGSMTVGISNSERASKIDERIDAKDTVDTLDGVRVRLTATDSVDIGDGDGTLGVSETLEGVGVIDDDGDDGIVSDDGVLTSVIGVISVISCDENTEPLGRRNEVSNEVSGPSGNAWDTTDGDAS